MEGDTTRICLLQSPAVTIMRFVSGLCSRCVSMLAVAVLVPVSARSGLPGHVPACERVAVFDNDGTVWPGQRLWLPLSRRLATSTRKPRARARGLAAALAVASSCRRMCSTNGEGGIRISKKPAGKTRVSRQGGTESGTVSTKTASEGEVLLSVAWDQLPEDVRRRLASLTPEVLAALHALFNGEPRRT